MEFPATGGAISTSAFQTVKLIRYVTVMDYIILACECIFILFTIYYSIEEMLEVSNKDSLIGCVTSCSTLSLLLKPSHLNRSKSTNSSTSQSSGMFWIYSCWLSHSSWLVSQSTELSLSTRCWTSCWRTLRSSLILSIWLIGRANSTTLLLLLSSLLGSRYRQIHGQSVCYIWYHWTSTNYHHCDLYIWPIYFDL